MELDAGRALEVLVSVLRRDSSQDSSRELVQAVQKVWHWPLTRTESVVLATIVADSRRRLPAESMELG